MSANGSFAPEAAIPGLTEVVLDRVIGPCSNTSRSSEHQP
jgi:hypothetical protein